MLHCVKLNTRIPFILIYLKSLRDYLNVDKNKDPLQLPKNCVALFLLCIPFVF